jgi:eukaryotic-like serine/threonine-protein kinase
MTDSEQARQSVNLGDVIAGKYRIECVLGSGGMAVVLAATQLDLDRLVAIKLMRAELAEHAGAVQRMLLEAKLTARFRSEHICKVLDVGTLPEGAPYVVMEYLDGSDFCTLLAQGRVFGVEEAVDFMLEACEAIAEAHAANIVHRDLKPENLFVANTLDGTPSIKVLDFGISKQLGLRPTGRSLTNPNAVLGSPNYMAPEQMQSARPVDARADIWALGVILYEVLAGRPAFGGESLPEVCLAVVNTEPWPVCELRPEVPEGLGDTIARCLAKAPEDRFTHVLDLAIALAPFGSSKAADSLRRVERVLTGGTLPGLTPSPPRYITGMASGRAPGATGAGGGGSATDGIETTGAAAALISPATIAALESSSPPRRSSWPLIGVAAGLLILGLVTVSALRHPGQTRTETATQNRAPGSEARADSNGASLAPTHDPALSATLHAASPAPAPAPQVSASASGSALVAAAARPATPVSAAARLPAGKADLPITAQRGAQVPAPAARSVAAPAPRSTPPPEARNRKAIEAWDPNSFGPRR